MKDRPANPDVPPAGEIEKAHEAAGGDWGAFVELEDVAGLLGLAAPAVEPPPGLRAELLRRVEDLCGEEAAESGADRPGFIALDQPGVFIQRGDALDWQSLFPHAEAKVLHQDDAAGVITRLVRLQPGAMVPAHRHRGVEEVYLLEGDLEVHGVRMRPGDYCRADSDTTHRAARSEGGALFLVRGGVADEILA